MSTTTPIALPAAHAAVEYAKADLKTMIRNRLDAHITTEWTKNGNTFSNVEEQAVLILIDQMTEFANRLNDPEKTAGLDARDGVQEAYDEFIAAGDHA